MKSIASETRLKAAAGVNSYQQMSLKFHTVPILPPRAPQLKTLITIKLLKIAGEYINSSIFLDCLDQQLWYISTAK